MVQDLVNQVQGAGEWLDEKQENRDKAVAIAAGKGFFNQDPNILKFVMENPTDRVTYGDLRMIREEFEDLMQLSIQAGTIKHPIAYETYIDERFVRAQKSAVHTAVIRRLALTAVVGSGVAFAASRTAGALKAGVLSPVMAAPELKLQGTDGKPLTSRVIAARWCCWRSASAPAARSARSRWRRSRARARS